MPPRLQLRDAPKKRRLLHPSPSLFGWHGRSLWRRHWWGNIKAGRLRHWACAHSNETSSSTARMRGYLDTHHMRCSLNRESLAFFGGGGFGNVASGSTGPSCEIEIPSRSMTWPWTVRPARIANGRGAPCTASRTAQASGTAAGGSGAASDSRDRHPSAVAWTILGTFRLWNRRRWRRNLPRAGSALVSAITSHAAMVSFKPGSPPQKLGPPPGMVRDGQG